MTIIITQPQQLCKWYSCSGLFFKDISNLKKYIKTVNGTMYFTYNAEKIDDKLLKKMVYMFPIGETLRYSTNGMCLCVVDLYNYNKKADSNHKKDVIKTLFESLFIHFSIKKYGDYYKQ